MSVSDREKLALFANYRCYPRKTIDHPDKKKLLSSSAAFNCLQEARRRLSNKQCDSVHNAYVAVAVVKNMFTFLIVLNCVANIAITMRRGKDLKPTTVNYFVQ